MRSGTRTPSLPGFNRGPPETRPIFAPGQQDIGAFEQTARVRELHRQTVVGLETFVHAPELHDQCSQHRQADKDEGADFKLQTFSAFTHGSSHSQPQPERAESNMPLRPSGVGNVTH